jgi:hypothetical protein
MLGASSSGMRALRQISSSLRVVIFETICTMVRKDPFGMRAASHVRGGPAHPTGRATVLEIGRSRSLRDSRGCRGRARGSCGLRTCPRG